MVVVVDNDDPTVQECPADITVNNDPGVCGAVVEYTVLFEDNCDGEDLIGYLVDGLPSGSTFPVGTTTVIWRYVDQASNDFAECLFKVTVIDSELPVITCPSNITVEIDGSLSGGLGGVPPANASLVGSGPCGVTLQYNPPVGTDNCPNPLTINTSASWLVRCSTQGVRR